MVRDGIATDVKSMDIKVIHTVKPVLSDHLFYSGDIEFAIDRWLLIAE